MKRILVALLALLVIGTAGAQVHVRGYFKKNGTYVAPYTRSAPNHSTLDNYSTRGNYNPYTGKAGTENPYPVATYSAPRVTYSAPAPSYSPPADYQAQKQYWEMQAAQDRARIEQMRLQAAASYYQQIQRTQMPTLSYGGNRCSEDCSGHDAGYEWAEENGITDPDDCGGNSQSFVEGCETFADEQAGD
jgi:hypothetical protein